LARRSMVRRCFFAHRNLWGTAAARRLEAQASLVLGHQLGSSKMPVDK